MARNYKKKLADTPGRTIREMTRTRREGRKFGHSLHQAGARNMTVEGLIPRLGSRSGSGRADPPTGREAEAEAILPVGSWGVRESLKRGVRTLDSGLGGFAL